MAYLIDTNILARLSNTADVYYTTTARAVMELHHRGEVLHVAPQNLIEFRNVATRPTAVNGLGLSISDAEIKAAIFETAFPLLSETPDIYPAWKSLVEGLGIVGKQVHDARLVAICHVHRVTHLLTFDTSHFVRMAAFGSGVTVIDPASI